jgi:hypothetical protein
MRKKRGVNRRAGRAGLVSREINCHRAEIAARAVHSVAAVGARGAAACGRALVGVSLGKRGDVALCESGVRFRTFTHEHGTIERWQQPELPEWEVPKRDPHERRPREPEIGAGGDCRAGGS